MKRKRKDLNPVETRTGTQLKQKLGHLARVTSRQYIQRMQNIFLDTQLKEKLGH